MHGKIGVIGGGSWGKALAYVASQKSDVQIWARNVVKINNLDFPANITLTNNLADLLSAKIILLVTPAKTIREICGKLADIKLPSNIPLVICAKGIEHQSLMLMSEIAEEILPKQQIAILSGPNFAEEIIRGMPAATNIAAKDLALAKDLSQRLSSKNFRIYPSSDLISTELAGAYKNVLAIACGITISRNLGENARAALITRGLNELKNLATAKGGKAESLMNLSGIGDIVLTCMSEKSRNFRFGLEIGRASMVSSQFLANNTVEGFYTIPSIYTLSKKLNIEMPICEALYNILFASTSIEKTIEELLSRPQAIN